MRNKVFAYNEEIKKAFGFKVDVATWLHVVVNYNSFKGEPGSGEAYFGPHYMAEVAVYVWDTREVVAYTNMDGTPKGWNSKYGKALKTSHPVPDSKSRLKGDIKLPGGWDRHIRSLNWNW